MYTHTQEPAELAETPETVAEPTPVSPVEERRPDLEWAYAPSYVPMRQLKVNSHDFTDLTDKDDDDCLKAPPIVLGGVPGAPPPPPGIPGGPPPPPPSQVALLPRPLHLVLHHRPQVHQPHLPHHQVHREPLPLHQAGDHLLHLGYLVSRWSLVFVTSTYIPYSRYFSRGKILCFSAS